MLSPRSRVRPWDQHSASHAKSRYTPIGGISRQPDYPKLSCAFHPQQKITNFCKNFECLLPMCPRCVKIHTEEHMKSGTHGDFQIISQCFKFLEDELTSVMRNAKIISEQANQLIKDRKFKLSQVKTTYQQAKKKLLEQIQRIFEQYEKELEEKLQVEEISFNQEVLQVEDSICFLLSNAKKGIESLYSAYALEHLIQYYSHQMFSFEESIGKCKQQLTVFNKEMYDLKIDTSRLEGIRTNIRHFFDGNTSQPIKFKAIFNDNLDTRSENIMERKIEGIKENSIRMQSTSGRNVQAVKSSFQAGTLANRLANSIITKNIETPLENFDISKSRSFNRQRQENI